MKSVIRFFRNHPRIALFVCGVLCALPFQFPFLFMVPFFVLVPVFLILEDNLSRKGLWTKGFSFFFGCNALIYTFFLWMYPLESTELPHGAALAVVCVAWLGISVAQGAISACIFPLFALASRRKSSPLSPLVFAALWVIFEFLLEQGTLGFPWNRLASGLYAFTPFIQSASLFGSLFLSFLAVLIPSLAARSLRDRRRTPALAAVILLALNLSYGILVPIFDGREEKTLKISAVQGNILSGEKWEEESLQNILQTYVRLTLEAEDCDLILWPETAVPVNLSVNDNFVDYYAELSELADAPILMGAVINDEAGLQQNAVAAIDSGGLYASYAKRHLVPFGEYLPWRSVLSVILPFLGEINQLSSDLSPGRDSAVMEAAGVKIGALVCFDSAFAPLSRDAVKDGAQLLVLATNDSWYKDSAATHQHLSQCVLRATENHRAVAVAANSGISAFITPFGVVTSYLPPLEEGVLTDTLSVRSDRTLYTLWGDAPLLSFCILILFVPQLMIIAKRKKT